MNGNKTTNTTSQPENETNMRKIGRLRINSAIKEQIKVNSEKQ